MTVEETNETVGVDNIADMNTSSTTNTTDFNGTGLEEFSGRIGDTFMRDLAGSYEMSGLLLLFIAAFGLYQSDAGLDVSAAVLLPSTFFLASQGFLPGGEGFTFAGLLVATAVGVFGVFKYATR